MSSSAMMYRSRTPCQQRDIEHFVQQKSAHWMPPQRENLWVGTADRFAGELPSTSSPDLFTIPILLHSTLTMSSPNLPPPFINVPGTANFRDIGNGTTIRKGLVYRSADPSKATSEGLKQMNEELGTAVRLPLLSLFKSYPRH